MNKSMHEKSIFQSKWQMGQAAEEAAAHFLLQQGYEVIERNFRTRQGEIDIIAKDGAVLVFVEVRSGHGKALYQPEETVNHKKQAKLRHMAEVYLSRKNWGDISCRFDVAAVIIDPQGQVLSLELIKDAFY
jgi:putative endonuclease